MKKLLLLLTLMTTFLSGCYMEPIRDHDGVYQRGHDDNDNDRDHHYRDERRGGDRDD
jgi:hypothetical protein